MKEGAGGRREPRACALGCILPALRAWERLSRPGLPRRSAGLAPESCGGSLRVSNPPKAGLRLAPTTRRAAKCPVAMERPSVSRRTGRRALRYFLDSQTSRSDACASRGSTSAHRPERKPRGSPWQAARKACSAPAGLPSRIGGFVTGVSGLSLFRYSTHATPRSRYSPEHAFLHFSNLCLRLCPR